MRAGCRCGAEGSQRRGVGLSVSLFVRDDGGYTTVAVALALLLSLSLVFAAASANWASARSSEVQGVADAAAMAGSNCVAAFATVAQVVDACVLSLGIAGVLVYGVGLIVAAVPVVNAAAPAIRDAGARILDARRGFARSAAQGLGKLESVLPAIIMANSASCVSANSAGGVEYVGCAVPFPATSQSDFSFLEDELDHEELDGNAEKLQEASERKREAEEKADDARERAWRADCVNDPLCLRERAETLAGMGGASNPSYASAASWRFGYALARAKNYYLKRYYSEVPYSSDLEELTRSATRREFYKYAYEELCGATCIEEGEHVVLDLPQLAHTSDMVRASSLYYESVWPCTEEEGGRTLHSTPACPGATGADSGTASLAELEGGSVCFCETCRMSVWVMGNVADASTNINNGFEHYWRIIVEEAEKYEQHANEAAEAEREMRELGEKSSDAFEKALEMLAVERPKLCPAGAWGCVSVVARRGSVSVPSELSAAFGASATLPAGFALSAATLAPDEATDGNNVLSRVLDGVGDVGTPVQLVGNVTELWGRLLVGYGSAYGSVSDTADDLFDGIGSLFGEQVASWLKGKLVSIVRAAGFEPADMRLRKPVLVHSQKVLDKAGLTTLGQARELLESLPASQEELKEANVGRIISALGVDEVTIAELPVPGLEGTTIPLTIDVKKLLEAA